MRGLLGSVIDAFGASSSGTKAAIEINVELAVTLFSRLDVGVEDRLPTAVVMLLGSAPDAARWFESLGWREVAEETFEALDVASNTAFGGLVRFSYIKVADHAVAGVAYHFCQISTAAFN